MWLLKKLSPDHKTIALFRKDNPEGLKKVFRNFVKWCMKLELYGKELISIDGSKFKAVNAKDRNFTKDKLKERLKRIEEKIEKYMSELDAGDEEEEGREKEKTPEEIRAIIKELRERKERYERYREELEETGEKQKSLTDSDSRLMPANGKMDICYNIQAAVDGKHKLITEFEVTNKANDKNQLTPIAEKAKEILEVETIKATADKGYAGATDIASAIGKGIESHVAGTDYDICIPVTEGEDSEITSHDDGKSVYIKERNIAICPMGTILYPRYYKKSRGEAVFRNPPVCKTCICPCSSGKDRKISYMVPMAFSDFRLTYDDQDLKVKQVHIKADKELYKHRKSLSEHPFGTIKRAMDNDYCLLKGIRKVSGEFSLTFLAYNLKRVINILGSKKLIEMIA